MSLQGNMSLHTFYKLFDPYLTNMKVQKPAVVLNHGLSSQLDYRTLPFLHLLILPPDINSVTQF